MTQYFVINRRVFPIILQLFLPTRSLWIYTLGLHFSIICSHWDLLFALGFLHQLEREILDLKCWGLPRTHPTEENWIFLLVFLPGAQLIQKFFQKLFLSCLLDIWSKPFFLLLNVFLCIDLVFCSSFLDQLTADPKILVATFDVRAISYA